MRAFLTRVDGVIVHTKQQANVAISLGAEHVRTLVTPAASPGRAPATTRAPYAGPARLVALGIVRPYKGLDLLLAALAWSPDLTLTIAGRGLGVTSAIGSGELAGRPELAGRVTLREGYVPAARIAPPAG